MAEGDGDIAEGEVEDVINVGGGSKMDVVV